MKRMIYLIIVTALVTIFTLPAEAQHKIVNYTDMNQINSLTEDGDFVWVCTSGGAFKRKKSDGSLVKVFNTENSGISRNSVQSLYIDLHGNYWFGTANGGISKFDGTTWTTIDRINGEKIYTVSKITEDLSGNLWFGEQGKVFKFDGSVWTKYILTGGYYVESIVADDYGNIWFGVPGYQGSFWKLDPQGVLTRLPGLDNKFLNNDGPYDIMKDSYGNLWIAYYGGAYKYSPRTGEEVDYGNQAGFNVYGITQDGKGRIWFGTANGIICYNGSTFKTYTSGRSIDRGNMALDVLADAQGNIWIGGYVGFAKVDEVNNTWTTPILINALPSNLAETILFDSNDKAFVYGQFGNTLTFDGTFWNSIENNSGTHFFWMKKSAIDNSNNKFVAAPASDTKLRIFKLNSSNTTSVYTISGNLTYTYSNEVVKDLKYDAMYGKIWIATNQGLFWFKISDNTFGKFNQAAGALKSDKLTALAINGSKVWYSTENNGIGYYDQSNNTWKGYSTTDGLPVNYASEMVFDPSNNLWILTSGLTKFDGTTFYTYTDLGIYPTHIACDHYGNIWLGSYSGVARFRDGHIKNYTTDDGLIENAASNIVVDAHNNIWIPTGYYGLTKLVPQSPVAGFAANTACLPGSTVLTNTSSQTDNFTTYEWDINNDGTVEYTTKDVSLVFPAKGIYNVKLRVSNDNLFSEKIQQVHVLEAPSLSLNLEGDQSICFGESRNLQVIINNPDPLLSYQVDWNNGIGGTQEIWVSDAGDYFATVSNGQCETQSPVLSLQINEPFNEEKICMVTVDPTSGKNMIVWERTSDMGIESYNIYKLFGNIYVPIGNVSALEISEYIDYNSSPNALAARYAISSIDTCGNESAKSEYHQTIHLGASEGIQPNTVVLDWTNYIDESKIWQPEWYYIYGGNDPSRLTLLDSVSNVFTAWNDLNPQDKRYYQILIKKSSPCVPKELNGKKASSKGGPYVHSLSNLEDNRLQGTGINTNLTNMDIAIYPNPLQTESRINWRNPEGTDFELLIYDLKGTLMRTESGLNSEEYLIMRENLVPGCYILELRGKNTLRGRLMVE